ncbi:amidase signature enzyme [Aaosphaeria arxii CBS 175.79]|uniref:Amidase signature enzyme n=1 Tax=Aaosphaeria arxii CBS 175.79 TaxID=1450172 RepID=A0A6A5Y563_9PLEO|nr:amidase signature enzyme [Aaosphaeria arxii CBS 175.79]KAF2020416.1 amidase signature enzyme [Aaosphaeria arxii CBS 175.79]
MLLPVEKNRFQLTADYIRSQVDKYSETDGVFQKAFLAVVVLEGLEEEFVTVTQQARDYLNSLGARSIICTSNKSISPGPYVIIDGHLRNAWKVVDDSNGTCMVTVKPQSKASDAFQSFPLKGSDDQFSCFALESRIKSQSKSGAPLAGMRVVVKENIHLKGIKTSIGNRAFYETYAPQDKTATCVQLLIDKGVNIIGKTKMNSLACWEEPVEYIDYQAPWNPRADHYQYPGGSSFGSAAAVSTYDWLDVAIGTDTWGSVTRPAFFGTVSAEGIEPCCQAFDTAGILSRDLKIFIDSKQTNIAQAFAKQMKEFLEATYKEVSFEGEWRQSPPPEGDSTSLPDFINDAANVQEYDAYHNLDDFRKSYQDQHGRQPYVSPPNQKSWHFAKKISREQRDEGFGRLKVYKKWFEDTFLALNEANTLVIMPQESMRVRYRDDTPSFERPPPGVNCLALAAVLEAPALTIPTTCAVAEIPYTSRISGRDEMLPFAVTVMGNAGTDLALLDTALKILEAAGLPTTLKTGTRMFC